MARRPGYHLLLLSLTLFPSAPVVLCALPSAWAARREPATRFLLAWIVPAWLVFEAVPTKLPHYTLPLFPGALPARGGLAACSPRALAAAALAGVACRRAVRARRCGTRRSAAPHCRWC